MFSTGHLIWIAISIVLIVAGIFLCKKKKPTMRRMTSLCLLLAIISEVIKFLSVIEIVPIVEQVVENGVLVYQETGKYAPYLQAEHMPFELCSLQIPFMFLSLIVKDDKWRKRIWSLMYGTSIIGGTMAVFLSSIAPEFTDTISFLTAPRAWQFFLYHAMIIVQGVYIGMSEEADMHFKDMKWMIILTLVLDCVSFYMNSIMSVPFYNGDELMGIAYDINYFSSYNNPLGIVFDEKWKWLLYLLVRIGIAILLIPVVYSPLLMKKTKKCDET
ncbi:MAG: YwaF family protein [Erysipelotrichaceae bacterium]|nr:YwaF family protein [Erysipelotrichaceae bacterium]